MNYSTELNFLCDTLQKMNIQTLIAELDKPLPPRFDSLLYPLLQSADGCPLSQLIPAVHAATVYTVTDWLGCCHIYFLLPELQPDAIMVIGPFLTSPVTSTQILEQAEMHNADPREHRRLEHFLSALPILPKSSQLHMMLEVFFDRIWGAGSYDKASLNRDRSPDHPWFLPSLRSEKENLLMDMTMMEERYSYENNLMEAIRQGQTWRVENIISRINTAAFEQRASDPIRNLKNYCIITNTLLRKAAEQGGVHPVYIDRLSSAFALRIEQLTSLNAGPEIIAEMAQDYCRLVRRHATKRYSAPVQKAIIIIDSELSAPLSLCRLAQQLNVNNSYLSSLFKKETDMTVTEYILNRRISHARYLLESTRLQIQTVAQLCGFEDVHYFSKVFKKLTEKTPKQYRQDILTQ